MLTLHIINFDKVVHLHSVKAKEMGEQGIWAIDHVFVVSFQDLNKEEKLTPRHRLHHISFVMGKEEQLPTLACPHLTTG
jgi:hypothetical protein